MKLAIIGGHLSPALSVMEALPKDIEILFVGRKYSFEGDKALSLEYKTVRSLNIPFAEITSGRLQRKLTRYTISSLLKFPVGIIQSFLILRKFKPDAVVGFGGYVSLAVTLSAFLMRIPVVIHEQTLEAGISNKIISTFAKKICISWDSSRPFFPKEKTVLTGNPVRKFTIDNFQFSIDKKLPTVYITGGSSGSHFINKLVEGCIKGLLEKFNVIHQTGDSAFGDFDRLANLRLNFPSLLRARYILKKFIDPSVVGSILSNSDLVISRAGVNTMTELIYFEKPAILIPIPFSQGSEQLKNAKFLESHNLGKVMLQNQTDSKSLYQEIALMFEEKGKYELDKTKSGSLHVDINAQKIVEVIKYVGKYKKSP